MEGGRSKGGRLREVLLYFAPSSRIATIYSVLFPKDCVPLVKYLQIGKPYRKVPGGSRMYCIYWIKRPRPLF